jgi:hypothetical protein
VNLDKWHYYIGHVEGKEESQAQLWALAIEEGMKDRRKMKKKNVERLRAEDKRKLEGKDMEEVIS